MKNYSFKAVSKRSILPKVKSKIPDFEREKAKILTAELFEYFEDQELGTAQKLGKIDILWMGINSRNRGVAI